MFNSTREKGCHFKVGMVVKGKGEMFFNCVVERREILKEKRQNNPFLIWFTRKEEKLTQIIFFHTYNFRFKR